MVTLQVQTTTKVIRAHISIFLSGLAFAWGGGRGKGEGGRKKERTPALFCSY